MENDISELKVTVMKVMRSNAGWYVGREQLEDLGDGNLLPVPHSRLSEYFRTEKEAQKELEFLRSLEESEES